VLLTFVLQRR